MPEHVAEPWGCHLNKNGKPVHIITAPPEAEVMRRIAANEMPFTVVRIALLEHHNVYLPASVAEATAKRIVACVNALAGIPTEVVERIDPKKVYSLLEKK